MTIQTFWYFQDIVYAYWLLQYTKSKQFTQIY